MEIKALIDNQVKPVPVTILAAHLKMLLASNDFDAFSSIIKSIEELQEAGDSVEWQIINDLNESYLKATKESN